jgi:anti-sigma regulatory factor (Ser/Thr protein kinase)
MEEVLHSTTVRADDEPLARLEEASERFLASWPGAAAHDPFVLRLTIREACTNALRHGRPDEQTAIVTLSFIHVGGGEHPGLAVEVTDSGGGMRVGGAAPPYPEAHLGAEFPLLRVLDQEVVARVESPRRIRLRSGETPCVSPPPGRGEMLRTLRGGGYGILMLCRCWCHVSYTLVPGRGNVLRLAGLRPVLDD